MCVCLAALPLCVFFSLSFFIFSYLCSVFQASKKNDCNQSAWAKGEQQQQQRSTWSQSRQQPQLSYSLVPLPATPCPLPAPLPSLCLCHSFAAFCAPSACVARGCAWQIYQMLPTYIYIYPYYTPPHTSATPLAACFIEFVRQQIALDTWRKL